jgi:hypothetical protein
VTTVRDVPVTTKFRSPVKVVMAKRRHCPISVAALPVRTGTVSDWRGRSSNLATDRSHQVFFLSVGASATAASEVSRRNVSVSCR